eukprot:8512378-Alexandrium_andersonii.AAC.1
MGLSATVASRLPGAILRCSLTSRVAWKGSVRGSHLHVPSSPWTPVALGSQPRPLRRHRETCHAPLEAG